MWLVFLAQLNHVMRDLMFVVCLYLFPNKLILLPSNSLLQQVKVVTCDCHRKDQRSAEKSWPLHCKSKGSKVSQLLDRALKCRK